MVNVASTAQTLSDDYAALGKWIGLATANQGNSSGLPLEVPAGAGGYQRAPVTWNSSGGGLSDGEPVTLNAPAGEYTFVILCSAQADANDPGDTVLDYCKIDTILNIDGQIVVTPKYTQT
ncbi:hypothetical protein [Mycobacterium sp.]|uniref:hypothetical protein n=1 Tax=Mycobacterium sp. TaxID=1785 RepID=UPI003BB09050